MIYPQKFKPNPKYLPNTPAIKPFKTVGLNGLNGLDFKPDYEPLETANFNGLPFKSDRLDHQERWPAVSSARSCMLNIISLT